MKWLTLGQVKLAQICQASLGKPMFAAGLAKINLGFAKT